MKEKKCVHPRRMVNLMRQFMLEASDLTFMGIIVEGDLWDHNWTEEEFPCDCQIRRTGHFEAHVQKWQEEDDSFFLIGYDFDEVPYVRNCFTKNFRQRCSVAKGFAGVTLALLHELGHFETAEAFDELFPDWDRTKALEEIKKKYKLTNNIKKANEEYFTFPDENLATTWAMNWLSDSKNRKTAKAFEKKFFACFE